MRVGLVFVEPAPAELEELALPVRVEQVALAVVVAIGVSSDLDFDAFVESGVALEQASEQVAPARGRRGA